MKKKSIIKVSIFIFSFLLLLLISGIVTYNFLLSAKDKKANEPIEFIIENGTPTVSIISSLKKENIIRNEFVLKIYSKLHPGVPKSGRYILTKAMSAKEIYNYIIDGKVTNDTLWITFVEGKRLTYIANQISKNFDYNEDEILSIMDDKEYIKELINTYDVLTDDILNEKIYHPLEGYLFPDTYRFNRNASIKDIIETMVATLDSKISKYEKEIKESGLSIHEIITLASLIELEGARSNDRKGVAGVFYNRLNNGWALGSDVTTYYAVGKDFSVDLSAKDLNSCNGYNTRGSCVKGLPVGPIASSSIDSIIASISPLKHDYYYFVADKNGKTYFAKTYTEHINIINQLKSSNLWYTYNN